MTPGPCMLDKGLRHPVTHSVSVAVNAHEHFGSTTPSIVHNFDILCLLPMCCCDKGFTFWWNSFRCSAYLSGGDLVCPALTIIMCNYLHSAWAAICVLLIWF